MRYTPSPLHAALMLSLLLMPGAAAQSAPAPVAPAAPTPSVTVPSVTVPSITVPSAPTPSVPVTPATASPVTGNPATGNPAPTTPVDAAPMTATTTALPAVSTVSLPDFLLRLQQYPSLVQARLAVEAAQKQLDAANFVLSASVSASSSTYLNVDPAPNVCTTMPVLAYTNLCAPIPGSLQTLNATLRASPLNVGDVGASREQARLNLELSRIGYRAALASVQTQALTAAQRVQLADNSQKLAQQAVDAAIMALSAAQGRVAGGGATSNDLAQAQIAMQQAQNALTQAQENATLARATLQDLSGNTALPNLESLTLPATGKPASVQQAEVALTRAQVVARQTNWNSLPAVQASYMHYSNNTTNTLGVGASIDSKTLSPALNVTYTPQNIPLNRVHDQITLAARFDFSGSTVTAHALSQNQIQQAQATLEATQRQAQLQLEGLNLAYQQAYRQLALSRQSQQLAQQQASDALKRRDLGLISPLEAAQAQVSAYQAQLNADQAALALSDAAGKVYTFLALPLGM